jgi:hypothetical protein
MQPTSSLGKRKRKTVDSPLKSGFSHRLSITENTPASQLRGLSASGCARSAITARQTD